MRPRSFFLTLAVGLGLTATPFALPSSAAPRVENPLVLHSFDGTKIVSTLMLPAHASPANPVPVVLRTHGWGGSRETAPTAFTSKLLDRGYAVFTWDSRGFGQSGGEANVGSPDYEVKDAQTILTYLGSRPDILRDGPGDPRAGWTGGSNAGGVQLNTAAVDRRIEAIVPEIAWGDLVRDLIPNDVPKQTWDAALYGAGAAGAGPAGLGSPAGPQTGVYAPEIHRGFAEIAATGGISEATRAWFAHKSTTARSRFVTTPTLIVQGSVDTLFPLEDAFQNYRALVSAGTPVKLMTYCAGHTLAGCGYPGGAGTAVYEARIVSWLDRWVKGLPVETGPEVEWQAQDGVYRGAPWWPLPGTRATVGRPLATGTLVGPGRTGGDGPADGNPAPADELGTVAARALAYGPATEPIALLGIPSVRLTGTLTGVAGHVHLELVDVAPDGTRVTVDDQTMPVRLDGGAFDRIVDLHGVSWMLQPGHSLELELTTGSAQYSPSRLGPYAVSVTAVPTLPLAFRDLVDDDVEKDSAVRCNRGNGKGHGYGNCKDRR